MVASWKEAEMYRLWIKDDKKMLEDPTYLSALCG
jgi:hypothetical protein